MPNCYLCKKPIVVNAIRIQFGHFMTTTNFVIHETEFTCPECSFSGLYKQIQQADDELEVALADLCELRLFVAEGLYGGKS